MKFPDKTCLLAEEILWLMYGDWSTASLPGVHCLGGSVRILPCVAVSLESLTSADARCRFVVKVVTEVSHLE